MVCKKCGTLLGPVMERVVNHIGNSESRKRCRLCGSDDSVDEIDIPYIFRYLVTQLASCNINIKLAFTDI